MQRSVSGWSLLNAAENKVRRRKGRAADIVALPSDGSGYESRRDREQVRNLMTNFLVVKC